MSSLPSILGRRAGESRMTPAEIENRARQAYHLAGFVGAHIEDQRLNDFERQFLENIGNKLFGQRRSGR